MSSFFPYGSSFSGGISVAAGDFNRMATPTWLRAPLSGMATQVNVYSGGDITVRRCGSIQGLMNSFSAFASNVHRRSTVAVGDVNGDGIPDIVVAAGVEGDRRLWSSMEPASSLRLTLPNLAWFQVFTSTSTNASGAASIINAPLDIALADINGSGRDVLFADSRRGRLADAIDILYPLSGQRVVPDPGISLLRHFSSL